MYNVYIYNSSNVNILQKYELFTTHAKQFPFIPDQHRIKAFFSIIHTASILRSDDIPYLCKYYT